MKEEMDGRKERITEGRKKATEEAKIEGVEGSKNEGETGGRKKIRNSQVHTMSYTYNVIHIYNVIRIHLPTCKGDYSHGGLRGHFDLRYTCYRLHRCARFVCTDNLHEALSQNKDLSRQVQELLAIRLQLQSERDGLSSELADTKDALKDALARLDAANGALAQLRSDFEHRLREKDEELENIRSDNICNSSVCLSVYMAVPLPLSHSLLTHFLFVFVS